ncbi:MAG: S8 family peptidase [Allosphingosinicella sp.]
MRNPILRTVGVTVFVMTLGACGGSGGGGVQPISAPPAPPPPPPPAPPPLPPPPPSSGSPFDTLEYQNSQAAVLANAVSAYEKGATGKGVTAAIIDDSFASTLSDFAGRVHPASQDVAASRGLDGEHHHGTAVASVLGAAKNDAGIHGVAFDSTLLMLRTDTPNTCTATSATCQFNQSDVAKAFDLAVQNGARVVNLSMAFPINPIFTGAIDKTTAAGVVVVAAAANEGGPEPSSSALVATKPEAHGIVIIAGGLNSAGTDLSSFSNRAGSGAAFYLAAASESLRVYDRNGVLSPPAASGTSFSAPTISGAVALIAQVFPNLNGQQIVNLLLTTATDMGAPGTDTIYGRGKLNLTNAFAPQGTMSLAGSTASLSLFSNGTLSSAMGDATANLKGTIFLDGYARAYEVDLSRTLSPAARDLPLHSALDGRYGTSSTALGPLTLSVTTRRDYSGLPEALLRRMQLSEEDALTARALAATAVTRLSARTAVAFGFSEGGGALQQRLSQQRGDAFLVARDPIADDGFRGRSAASLGIRHDFGPLALTVTSESGEVRDLYRARHLGHSGYRATSLVADRELGRIRFSFGGSLLREEVTILGGRLSSGFSSAGSTSWFADGAAAFDLGSGWSAQAGYRQGWTSIPGGDALVKAGRLSSNAFAFDLARTGAFTTGDRIALRFMQPLRVRSGGLDIYLPVSYDYGSGEAGYQRRFFNLAPTGRELDYELSYEARLLGGNMAANAFVRREPGHIDRTGNDVGGALRFTLGF